MSKMSFLEWMKLVDLAVAAETGGLSYMDLADQDWYGWYGSEVPPKEAAEMALQDEGFYKFVFGS